MLNMMCMRKPHCTVKHMRFVQVHVGFAYGGGASTWGGKGGVKGV